MQLIWLGDLYGQPLIQYMSRTSSRESYDEGIKEARGKVCSLDGDELEIQTALGGTFRLTDQMAVKPDEVYDGQYRVCRISWRKGCGISGTSDRIR